MTHPALRFVTDSPTDPADAAPARPLARSTPNDDARDQVASSDPEDPTVLLSATATRTAADPSPAGPTEPAEVVQLAIPDLAEPPRGPAKFRLDRATRLRGLAHVAEIRALLNRRSATVGERPANDRAPDRAA